MPQDHNDEDKTQSHIPLTKGAVIGHYQIIKKIGAGGMGEVYLAEDTKLKRQVALKFLPHQYASDRDLRERFTREAQAAAKLDHPNIVPVYEVGEYQDRPYFAMAHIEGQSLRDVIKDGRLGINEAIDLTMQICEGLHKAHEAGVVHRDIKPSNIIIDNDGRARLVDFGLAMVSGEDKLTKTGSTLGTAGYMSPEQVTGKKVDHRADIFSTGVILYEMLTGRKPFEGDNEAAIARAITDTSPEPIARFKSGTSGELQQIIDKALSKDPDLRYQHADGMLADLKRLGTGAVRSSTSGTRLWIAAAVIIVVAIAAYFIIDRYQISEKKSDDGWTNSIAVLVFRDLSPDKDQEWFCEGMTDEIIGRLGTIRRLKVTSMHSILRFKGTDLDLKAIGKELGVANILEGNIQRSNDRIRVRVQLIRIDDDAHIWSERYESEATDVFKIQDEISIAIGNVLEVTLLGDEEVFASRQGTENLEAYNNYLQGRYFWRKRTADGMRNALDYFQRAVDIDSSFALAWSGLADTWSLLLEFTRVYQPEAIPNAIQASRKAVELDGSLAEAHASLGLSLYQDGSLAEALTEYEQALEINPQYVWTHIWYGNAMENHMRRKDIMIDHLKTAVTLDPLNIVALNNLAYVLSDSGLYEEAERYYLKVIEVVPENVIYRKRLAGHYQRTGQLKKMIEVYEEAVEIDPDYWDLYYWYAESRFNLGQKEEAIGVFEDLVKKMPDSINTYHTYGRFLYYYINDYEEAIYKFNKCLELNPQVDEAYNLLAYSYSKVDDFNRALESINRAIEIAPDNYNYIDTRADVYLYFGHFDDAIYDYKQFLIKHPNNMSSLEELAQAATFGRYYDLADSAYRVMANRISIEQRGWGLYTLSQTLRHQGKFRQTLDKLTENIEIIRKEVGISFQLGIAFWNRSIIYSDWIKDNEKALEDLDSLEHIVEAIPKDPTYREGIETVKMGRIYVYVLKGEPDKADELLSQVDPSHFNRYDYWVGLLEIAKGNSDLAINYLEKDKEMQGSINANDKMWLGLAYLENAQYKEAITYLEQSAFRFDNVKANFADQAVWTHYLLAQAYEGDGRIAEAIEQYETFLDIWKQADEGLQSVEDAKSKLAKLKSASSN
jgi:serine/threonine protein kinase/tetratricopeptide (TPR) repeat protein